MVKMTRTVILCICLMAFKTACGQYATATSPWYYMTTTTTPGFTRTTCHAPKCASCPYGYRSSIIHEFGCNYRCVCEISGTTTQATTACGASSCANCPYGYRSTVVKEHGCSYRCLCERDWSLTTSTHAPPPSTTKSMSRNLLLQLLHNIQSNADAIEKMAVGLSEEANMAENMAAIAKK